MARAARAAGRAQMLGPLLAWIVGATDAIGLLASGTYFLGFMAGNATRLATTAAFPDQTVTSRLIALTVLFVVGVTVATLVGAQARRRGVATLLLAQALLLALAAWLPAGGHEGAALAAAVLAMAFAHALIGLDDGGAPTGLPVTGVLVRLGRGLAEAISGGMRAGWVGPLLIWAIIVVGGIAGALLQARLGYAAFWMPAIASFVAALSQWPAPRYADGARGPGGRRRG